VNVASRRHARGDHGPAACSHARSLVAVDRDVSSAPSALTCRTAVVLQWREGGRWKRVTAPACQVSHSACSRRNNGLFRHVFEGQLGKTGREPGGLASALARRQRLPFFEHALAAVLAARPVTFEARTARSPGIARSGLRSPVDARSAWPRSSCS